MLSVMLWRACQQRCDFVAQTVLCLHLADFDKVCGVAHMKTHIHELGNVHPRRQILKYEIHKLSYKSLQLGSFQPRSSLQCRTLITCNTNTVAAPVKGSDAGQVAWCSLQYHSPTSALRLGLTAVDLHRGHSMFDDW